MRFEILPARWADRLDSRPPRVERWRDGFTWLPQGGLAVFAVHGRLESSFEAALRRDNAWLVPEMQPCIRSAVIFSALAVECL